MAEVTWTEEGPSAPPKKKIPTWMWFCGGGCLALIVLGVVAAGVAFKFAKKAMDPETQWAELAKVLPYDERPQNLKILFGNQLGGEQFQLHDDRSGFSIQIQHHTGKDGTEGREKLFGSDTPEFPSNLLVMKFEDMKPGLVNVQGRDLRVIRMRMEFAGIAKKMMPKDGEKALGAMIFVDLTQPNEEGMLFLQVTREGGADPISDEELGDLLKPFHVGPKR